MAHQYEPGRSGILTRYPVQDVLASRVRFENLPDLAEEFRQGLHGPDFLAGIGSAIVHAGIGDKCL
jgi:hypothetical protein